MLFNKLINLILIVKKTKKRKKNVQIQKRHANPELAELVQKKVRATSVKGLNFTIQVPTML